MEKSKIVNSGVKVEDGFLIVTKDGKTYQFELKKLSERLAKASDEQLKQFTVSASGYGIHWHAIDEDISIPALLNEQVLSYGKKNSKG
ncbi:MAG: DUF2442 domain-containing protein [Bacteroidota bacterium]